MGGWNDNKHEDEGVLWTGEAFLLSLASPGALHIKVHQNPLGCLLKMYFLAPGHKKLARSQELWLHLSSFYQRLENCYIPVYTWIWKPIFRHWKSSSTGRWFLRKGLQTRWAPISLACGLGRNFQDCNAEWEGGSRGRGYVYTYSCFALLYSRN